MRLTTIILGLVFCVCGCGEKNVCEKALDVQREFCKGYEDCLQCGCVTQGYHCVVEWDKLSYKQFAGIRIPDFVSSGVSCAKPSTCEGIIKDLAENCLTVRDRDSCAPWIYYQPLELYLCYADMGFETVYCEY